MGETNKSPETEDLSFDGKMLMTAAPHIKSTKSTQKIMLDVIIALLPAMIWSIISFGLNAAILIGSAVASAVVFEALTQKLFKKDILISDLSAVVTGILVAFNLPAGAPWWVAVFGSAFAVIIVKEFFGGIGSNFMNPALAARAVLLASWPDIMTTFVNSDMRTTATPLSIMKEGGGSLPGIDRLLIGNMAGTIGEISALLLIIGGIYLILRKVIDWKVPVCYIGATAITLFALGVDAEHVLIHLLSGGLILGAFFMATDYATTPITIKGKIVFAVGAGFLTAIFRIKGGMPEGVSYAILLMNAATPIIERFTKPKVFGEVK